MSAPSDLASLSAVKTWLGLTGTTTNDAQLAQLITSVSRGIYAALQRPSILPMLFTEVFDPRLTNRYFLRNYPVISVSSLTVGVTSIPPAPTALSYGYVLDTVDPTPPGRAAGLSIRYGCYCSGVQDVVVAYNAGYQISAEAQTVPTSPYQIVVNQPFGAMASDQGVAYANGTAMTKVAASPIQGQYSVAPSTGTYTFAVADVGAGVLISYGYIPADLAQACIEWVGLRFKAAGFIGQRSKSLGGQETVLFDNSAMTQTVQALIQPYKRLAPC